MDREAVAHELRTPLTTIKGVLRLVTAGRLEKVHPDQANELLQRAWAQVVRLEQVVAEVETQFTPRAAAEEALVLYEERAC